MSLDEKVWMIYRKDDNGNTFLVKPSLTKTEAERILEKYKKQSHKQTYWMEENKK